MVDSGRSVPRSVLDLVEERNEEERLIGAINLGLDAVQIIDDDEDDDPRYGIDARFGTGIDQRFTPVETVTSWSHSREVPVEALPIVVDDEPTVEASTALAPAQPAARVSTETERFAQILERLAHSTEHRPAHYEPAIDTDAPAPATARQAQTLAAAPIAPEAVLPRAPQMTAPQMTAPQAAATQAAPAAPVAQSAQAASPSSRPAVISLTQAESRPSGAEEIIERPEQLLVRLGLPARFVPRGLTGSALRDGLVESLTRLPRAAELPKTKGVVVAIVGLGARPVLLGRSVSEELGLDPDEVVVATQSEIDGVPAWLQITEPDAADERRRSWRRRDQLTFVAISQPSLTTGTAWASDMLDRLEPTQLWGLASAGWKPEDVDAWSRRLGGFDALALDRLVDTVSPASMLSLGMPIGRLDGTDATPPVWADLLLDRISSPDGAGTVRATVGSAM